MRYAALSLLVLLPLVATTAAPKPAPPPDVPLVFAKDVQPILARCTPCHFPGGSMYAQLPFDRGETVVKLGTKLFSRIKSEKEQATIRRFLSEQAAAAVPSKVPVRAQVVAPRASRLRMPSPPQ